MREMCVDSDMTRQLKITKIHFWESIKSFVKIGLVPRFLGTKQASKKGNFLVGPGNSRIFF